MRLLQLATAPDRLIDLHPNVTVLSGLDDGERRLVADTVGRLAQGRAPDRPGLLEAHGLLFDLSDEMLSLLDVAAEGLHPIVTAAELSTVTQGADATERLAAEQELAAIEDRWRAAEAHQRRLRLAYEGAMEALERARRDADETATSASERTRSMDELTAGLDHVDHHRRRLQDEHARVAGEADAAATRRSEVEAASADVRRRHQDTAIASSELSRRLEQARLGLDPESVPHAEAARVELSRVEAEVTAERFPEAGGEAPVPADDEPLTERLARVEARIQELEKRRAALGPTDTAEVSRALDELRGRAGDAPVPSPEAEALADQIAALDEDLAAISVVGSTGGGAGAARRRLDDARRALLEAEHAVRSPQVDRDMVDRLEVAHAQHLDALEKADGRFAGGRAQRRVEATRSVEQALLDQVGFVSYADYMIGYSLLTVDPAKEAALDAARAELAAAEDEWRILQGQADAELALVERTDRRRRLLDEAATLLGRPVAGDDAVHELRALRVPPSVPSELVDRLQRSLERAGIAIEGEPLEREELVVLAEAWLDQAREAAARHEALQADLVALDAERGATLAAIDDVAARAPRIDEASEARLTAVRAAANAADERRRRHHEAEVRVESLALELAAAVAAAERAAEEASGAEAALAEAGARADLLGAEVVRIVEELAALDQTAVEVGEELRSLAEQASPEQRALEVANAEAALAEADARLAEASASLQDLVVQRTQAQARLASLQDSAVPVDEASLAEEIEWYLLARLAAQRAVCLGGSLPLLLDDALAGLGEDQLGQVLGGLERMADAVQVIVVTDDPLAASWALAAGQDRAAVVRPQPA